MFSLIEAQIIMSAYKVLWPVKVIAQWFEVMGKLPLHFRLEWLLGRFVCAFFNLHKTLAVVKNETVLHSLRK